MSKKVSDKLGKIFGSNYKVKEQGNVVKVNVQSIDDMQLLELSKVAKNKLVEKINLKRSGTGITILVTT